MTDTPKVEKTTTDQNEPLAPGQGEVDDPTDAAEAATYVAPEEDDGEDTEDR